MSPPPLGNIRVLDFGQIVAIPFAGQILAWLGAEVVMVERHDRVTTRGLPPFAGGLTDVNRSAGYNLANTNKLSCTLDLAKPEGVALAKQLISISDVMMENFSTGAIDRLGLGYDVARRLRPDIIYLSMGAFGRTGPMKGAVGLHSVVNAFSGLAAATGYPGGHPRILGGILPDLLSAAYCAMAVLQSLHHRSRTGEGQYLDIAMTELLATLIPEAVADYSMNGREAERVGNRDKLKAPHNVYRCRGEQKWVAISVSNDEEWGALCRAMEHLEWTRDARFSDQGNRWKHQDELDLLIESWTRERDARDLMVTLQDAGVPAAQAVDSGELLRDPQLAARGFVVEVDHPEAGVRPMGTTSWQISGSAPLEPRHAPLLGQHNGYVLGELLDLPERETRRLMDEGVVGIHDGPSRTGGGHE